MKLYMDSVDAAVFGGSDISIVLIGGFAGYSNFGDILQVLSALDFYKCKLPHACIAVAIDAEAQEIWQKSLPPRFKNIAMPIYMVENGHAHNAPTVPDGWSDQLTLPGAFILHFYGGGYVAPEWGPRKRLAGEYFLSLCKAVGIKAHVYFSGIQVTDDAEACLWRDLWSHASIIGARDPTSLTICKQVLGNGADAKLFLQGDDALPPLSWMLQRRTSASSVRRNCIGVHVAPVIEQLASKS